MLKKLFWLCPHSREEVITDSIAAKKLIGRHSSSMCTRSECRRAARAKPVV